MEQQFSKCESRQPTDTRQSENFIGLPTPACALVVISIPYIIEREGFIGSLFQSSLSLILLALILSYLLVAELPLLSLKFKDLNFRKNQFRYILVALGSILFAFFNFAAIPLIILIYILLSIIQFNIKT